MNSKRAILGLLVLLALGVLVVGACATAAAPTPTAAPAATSAATASPADLALGKTVFEANCNVCHPGGDSGVGPVIKGKSPDLVKKQVRQGGKQMPVFGPDKINDQQLDAVAAYVSSLK